MSGTAALARVQVCFEEALIRIKLSCRWWLLLPNTMKVSSPIFREPNSNSREVLGLYRKRGWAGSAEGHVVSARFRYSDMKEAGRYCGGRGVMQIEWWEGGVLRCAQAVP
jgi:hypothetical protein